MEFAEIFDKWERQAPHEIYKKDDEIPDASENERRRLILKKPDASIDLHGLTQDEAWDKLDDFFRISRSRGHEKILLIHGKGNHSKNEGVLGDLCRRYIEYCPFAGKSGRNTASKGGSGATWVLLKTLS